MTKTKGQNALKREAITKLLIAHPDWSDRRIAAAVRVTVSVDPMTLAPIGRGPFRLRKGQAASAVAKLDRARDAIETAFMGPASR